MIAIKGQVKACMRRGFKFINSYVQWWALMDHFSFSEVKDMIAKKREDKYWDYKEFHHENQADLLHDILCMANNADLFKPSYLIFGIDNDGNVKGVKSDDPNRKNQQQIINLLKDKKFAEGKRPPVHMRSTLDYDGKVLDILIIENTLDTPYYLTEDFSFQPKDAAGTRTGKPRTAKAYHIYTRINDTNVDIDKSADPHIVEKLWKKRFGLLLPPLLMFRELLEAKQEWMLEENVYYHIYHPEYTIELKYDSEKNVDMDATRARPFPPLSLSGVMKAKYSGTTLYSRRFSGKVKDCITFPPEESVIPFSLGEKPVHFGYFTRGSLLLCLYHFLNHKPYADLGFNPNRADMYLSSFIIFESEEEERNFNIYAQNNFDKFVDFGGQCTPPGNIIPDETRQALKLLLDEYRRANGNKN